jgi:hypothetical protein
MLLYHVDLVYILINKDTFILVSYDPFNIEHAPAVMDG